MGKRVYGNKCLSPYSKVLGFQKVFKRPWLYKTYLSDVKSQTSVIDYNVFRASSIQFHEKRVFFLINPWKFGVCDMERGWLLYSKCFLYLFLLKKFVICNEFINILYVHFNHSVSKVRQVWFALWTYHVIQATVLVFLIILKVSAFSSFNGDFMVSLFIFCNN